MTRRKLTCPESAHLEEIDAVEDSATGAIVEVTSCTAFEPPDSVNCDAVCAERLNDKIRHTITPDAPLATEPVDDEALGRD